MKSTGDRTDLLLGVGTALVAAIVIAAAWRLPPALYDPLGPAGLPLATAIVLVVLSLGIVAKWHFANRGKAGETTADESESAGLPWKAMLSAALMAVFLGLLEYRLVGFREATLVLFMLLSVLFRRQNWRELFVTALCAAVLSYGGYWLFTEVLIVNLPG